MRGRIGGELAQKGVYGIKGTPSIVICLFFEEKYLRLKYQIHEKLSVWVWNKEKNFLYTLKLKPLIIFGCFVQCFFKGRCSLNFGRLKKLSCISNLYE